MKSVVTKLTAWIAGIVSCAVMATGQEGTVKTAELPGDHPSNDAGDTPTPVVQLALLLDTSGSMQSLIDQAKTQLWGVVNEFITAKQGGKTPFVQVALYEYGKSSLAAESNWIRQIQPLTRDLDKISEELFALRTNGGDEYCGAVIREAAQKLAWDTSPSTYKAIFIAGNEPFTQGPVPPQEACKEAITKGIIVNTIHCGSEQQGLSGGWKDGALLADGSFMVINQNQAVVQIEAPQDAEIVKLNQKLNDTYVVWGARGAEAKANQIAQDANSGGIALSNLASRARTKASANYWNAGWDLVDACQQKDFKWENVKKEDLPEELRKLTTEELKAHVEKQHAARGEIKKQILDLTTERNKYVAAKRRELGKDESLGGAVATAVRKQAAEKGVTFEGR